ncbi:MAG TPA: protein kinase [Ktedonobacteraceae bacterium]
MPGREGQYIDDYRLVRPLGSGTFGEVYLGEHQQTRELAAVKLLQLTDEDLRAFVREASIAFRLTHRHIVHLRAFGISAEDTPYLIMDYAPGGTLRQRHPRGTRLPLKRIVSYLNPLAAALQYAHESGVIHRDVKPENVLIGPNSDLLLSDFGIALIAPIARSISTQSLSGTVPYMAPEQIRGKPHPASDQYALGIMVYEWLCGVRPFQGTLVELLDHHRSSPPPSLRDRLPALPSRVEDVIFKALAKEPAQRFARVQDFALALQQAISNSAVARPSPALPSSSQPASPGKPEATPFVPPVASPPAQPPARKTQENQATPGMIMHSPPAPVATPKGAGRDCAGELPAPSAPGIAAAPSPQPAAGLASPHLGRNGAASKKNEAANAAGPAIVRGPGAPGPGVRPTGLTPLPPPYLPRRGRRRFWRGRTLLLLLLLCLLLAALAVGVFATQGWLPGLPGILTARVTITPLSKLEADNYLLAALPTGTPDPARRQISARLLTQTSGTSSATGNATGSIAGQTATGQLTFQNVGSSGVTIGSGVLTGADGVAVQFSGPIFVPTTGSSTVTGFAVNPGVAGNIAALDVDGRCCAANVFVKNLTAFSGGRDPVPNSVIQQSDIQKAAQPLVNSLTQSTGSALQTQVRPGERVVDQSFQCQPAMRASAPAGTTAKTVTVSVQMTCREEVYDFAAAESMATSLLQSKAQQDPDLNAHYALQGTVATGILNGTVMTAEGQVSLEIQAQGRWVYQLTTQRQQNIKNALVRLAQTNALNVLQHETGIAAATISLSVGNALPAHASAITLVIQAPPGVQAPPTGTANSHPTVLPAAPTATPVNGLGGS